MYGKRNRGIGESGNFHRSGYFAGRARQGILGILPWCVGVAVVEFVGKPLQIVPYPFHIVKVKPVKVAKKAF